VGQDHLEVAIKRIKKIKKRKIMNLLPLQPFVEERRKRKDPKHLQNYLK